MTIWCDRFLLSEADTRVWCLSSSCQKWLMGLGIWEEETSMISSYCTTFLVKVMTVLTLELILREGIVVVFGEVFVFRKTVRLAVGIWIRFWHKQRPPHICGPIFLVVELSGSRLLFRMSTSCPSGSRKGACDQHRMFRCSKTRLLWKCRWRFPTCFNMWALQSKHRWRQKHLQS